MAHSPLTIAITSAAAATAVLAAGVAADAKSPAEVPSVVKPANQVVSGYLAPSNFQAAVSAAGAQYQAKLDAERKAAYEAAVSQAVVAKWQAEAAAAQAAAEAAAAQAAAEAAAAQAAYEAQVAYEQSVAAAVASNWRAQAAQAPAQSYSAPAQSYSAPAQTYSAPVQSYGGGGDASSWANSGAAMAVKNCESGNNYSTNTGNGYYGAWQFDIPSWLANGGGAYAATPDQAPAWAQDQVAYNYYQSAGWGPWSCAQ